MTAHIYDSVRPPRGCGKARDQNGRPLLNRDETIRPDANVQSLGALDPFSTTMGDAGERQALLLELSVRGGAIYAEAA
ncbi:MAG: hypothetical protein RJS97_02155 [Parvibaculaceae bacterium]